MRTFAVLAAFSVFFFNFEAILVAQPGGGAQRGGGPQGGVQFQAVQVQQGGTPQRMPMQPGGQAQPPWVQGTQPATPRGAQPGAQGNQQARPVQPAPAAQGNQQARPPAALNPNQVTQIMARLRAMDTNQNGVLEANEIPANQRDRVNTMITQLGGNPNSNSFNLANLERRAMATAGGAQPNQQPNNQQQRGDGTERQQRQQTPAPLVPAFGEQVAIATPVLGFGQRAPVVQATPQAARGAAGQQRNAANQQQSFAPPVVVRTSTPHGNIPAALRNNATISWFFEFDTDGDGQLSMQEYVAGRGGVWTEEIAAEFAGAGRALDSNGNEVIDVGLDRNGDGFATLDEVLLTIRERSEWWPQEQAAQQTVRAGQQAQQVRQPATTPANVRPQSGNAATNVNVRPQSGNATANQGNAPVRMQGNPQMGPGGRGAANQQSGRGGRGGG